MKNICRDTDPGVMTSVDETALARCKSLATMPGFAHDPPARKQSSRVPPRPDFDALEKKYEGIGEMLRANRNYGKIRNGECVTRLRCLCGCGQRWDGGVRQVADNFRLKRETLKGELWRNNRIVIGRHVIIRG